MGEIRNARCLLLQVQWLQYADQQVDPMCRSRTGSITPVMTWLLYADHQVEPIGRSLTIVISLTLVAIFVPQFLAMYYDAKQKQDSNEFEYDYR